MKLGNLQKYNQFLTVLLTFIYLLSNLQGLIVDMGHQFSHAISYTIILENETHAHPHQNYELDHPELFLMIKTQKSGESSKDSKAPKDPNKKKYTEFFTIIKSNVHINFDMDYATLILSFISSPIMEISPPPPKYWSSIHNSTFL